MSVVLRGPIGRQSRPTVRERLAKLRGMDETSTEMQLFLKEVEEVAKKDADVMGFRWHSKSAQNVQDRDLGLYYQYVRSIHHLPEDVSGEELDLLAFPSPNNEASNPNQILMSQLRHFLGWIIPRLIPRSSSDPVVGYSTMVEYRNTMLFWVRRKFLERNETPPPSAILHNTMTEAIQYQASELQLKLLRPPREKSYLGLAEIMQLIDMDIRATPNIAFAECHHLAWCIGRQCALRPSSLGPQPERSRNADDHFRGVEFRDFLISRGSNPGEFNAILTLRRLKGEGFKRAETTGSFSRMVKFHFQSPQKIHNLMFSVPHRILVLALRRGALQNHSTIESILDGQEKFITFKPEFMSKPVFTRGTARGLSIDPNQPLSADKFSEYITLRGSRAGYSQAITFSSIRRRACTDFVKAFGPEIARNIMSHDAETRTMERHYLDRLPQIDTSAAALGEDVSKRAGDMYVDSHRLFMQRLSAQEVAEIFSKALNVLVRQALMADEQWLNATSTSIKKNRQRIIRRTALKQLMEDAHEERQRTTLNEEWQARRDEFTQRATEFNKQLLARIQAGSQEDTIAAEDEDTLQGIDFEHDFDESRAKDKDEEGEPDFEDQWAEGGGPDDETLVQVLEENVLSETMTDYTKTFESVSYNEAVSNMMLLIYDNGMNEHTVLEKRQCPLCLDDDTVDEESKSKYWRHHALQQHMAGRVHSKFSQIKRTALKLQVENDWPGLRCEFCTAIMPQNTVPVYFKEFRRLADHWSKSTDTMLRGMGSTWTQTHVMDHRKAMMDAGWGEPDFRGEVDYLDSAERVVSKRKRAHRALEDSRLTFDTNVKELPNTLPVPGQPHLTYGSFTDWSAAAQRRSQLRVGSILDADHQPSHSIHAFAGILTVGGPPGAASSTRLGIEEYQDTLKYVPVPGTAGGMLGQGNRFRDRLASL